MLSADVPGCGRGHRQSAENEPPSCRDSRGCHCFDFPAFLIAVAAALVRGERIRFVDELAEQARVLVLDGPVPDDANRENVQRVPDDAYHEIVRRAPGDAHRENERPVAGYAYRANGRPVPGDVNRVTARLLCYREFVWRAFHATELPIAPLFHEMQSARILGCDFLTVATT